MGSFMAVLNGLPATLLLSTLAFAIGAIGGIPLAQARQSKISVVRFLAQTVIELLRGIPPIVWLFIVYFGIGSSVPQLSAMTAAAVGLGLISCAYMAEIYRGGLAAISQGQWEAAAALGMRRRSIMLSVIGPQVARVSIPAASTYAIGLVKDSSVAYAIGVTEILYFANQQSTVEMDAIVPFIYAALIYLVMTVPCAWAARSLDATLRKRVAT